MYVMDDVLDRLQVSADTDVIKQASRLIGEGRRLEALELLEQCVLLQPQSRLLLQAAGRLCLQQGESTRAAAYLERALAVNNTSGVDNYDQYAVDETDFDYLEEQAQDLDECDYVIPGLEAEAPVNPSPKKISRKTLTLSESSRKERALVKSTSRVRYKPRSDSELAGTDDKATLSPRLINRVAAVKVQAPQLNDPATPQTDFVIPEPLAATSTTPELPADTDTSPELASPPRPILKLKNKLPELDEPAANKKMIIKRRLLFVETPEYPDEVMSLLVEPEGLSENTVVLDIDTKAEPVVLDDVPSAISEQQVEHQGNSVDEGQSDWPVEAEPDGEQLPALDVAMGFDDELFVDFDGFDNEDSAESFFSDPVSGDEVSGLAQDETLDSDEYGLWDDMQASAIEAKEEEVLPQGPEDGVSRSERARQKAVEVILRVGWEAEQLEFLTQVFIENGWAAARKAIEREIQAGTTFEQLELAREIRLVWKECDRYWITFSKLNAFSQVTDAVYMNLSWSQALRIIRVFQYIPCADELESFLDDEFEFWYSNKILRLRYPAFIKYLNYYRINSDYPYLSADEVRCFDSPVSYDAMSSDEFMYTHSDAVEQLRGYGIDVFADYAPKNYYVTDDIFDPALFEKKKNDQPLAAEEEQGSES
jgi:hypothetical protein